MDGIHDLGGKQGFGRVEAENTDLPLPERWQGFVFTMINQLLRSGIAHNVDYFRHAVERISPNAYLEDGYYGRWLGAGETILVEAGVVTQDEVNAAVAERGSTHPGAARPSASPERFPTKIEVEEVPPTGERQIESSPLFGIGTSVRTLRHGKSGHTRLPAYARDANGVVVACHNAWVYPDSHAHGEGEAPEYLYTVEFSAKTLFGQDCESDTTVCLDLFESYLTTSESTRAT